MLAMAGDGVGLVHRLVTFRGQIVGLRQFGPAGEIFLFTAVELAHLLQADDVGIQLLDRVAQVMDLQPPGRPQTLDAFVDVVSGHPKNCHGIKRGNISIASALEGEKQASAAAWYGNHW